MPVADVALAAGRVLLAGGRQYPVLIDTEQRPIGGRTEEQLDDRYGFGGELGITIIHPGVKDGPGEPGAA